MPFAPKCIISCCLVLLTVAVTAASAPAAVYKYKKDGVWHFTDDPGAVPASRLAPPAQNSPAVRGDARNLQEKLTAALRPANDIERATLATVAVETSFGYGSGFFRDRRRLHSHQQACDSFGSDDGNQGRSQGSVHGQTG